MVYYSRISVLVYGFFGTIFPPKKIQSEPWTTPPTPIVNSDFGEKKFTLRSPLSRYLPSIVASRSSSSLGTRGAGMVRAARSWHRPRHVPDLAATATPHSVVGTIASVPCSHRTGQLARQVAHGPSGQPRKLSFDFTRQSQH